MNILQTYPQPIIGLAPMDGVTDTAYRLVQKRYGNPDVMFTEFTHVIGLCRGIPALFNDQLFFELERPIIGQIYGSQPEYFYHAAKIIAALGFDGIDINMGCPAKNVTDSGSGAALIRTPLLAQEIVRQVKRGLQDYFADKKLTGIDATTEKLLQSQVERRSASLLGDFPLTKTTGQAGAPKTLEIPETDDERARNFTVSVKTRIGFQDIVISDWVKQLTEVEPDFITVHGRTLKQMYTGQADWDAIATAVENTHVPILANGDVTNLEVANKVIQHTKTRGALIGRGSYGNPWVFQDPTLTLPSLRGGLGGVIRQHAHLHWQLKGERGFVQMRKNLAWYIKNMPNAAEFRTRLVLVNNPTELEAILQEMGNTLRS